MVTGLEPQQVTDPLKIIIFNKHLFNREIRNFIAKGYHRNLKEAFDNALAAERKAKKFKGLTDNGPSVMAITARRQVNQVTATTQMEQSSVIADLKQIAADGMQPTNTAFNRQKFHNNCYKCGERGHYARELPLSLTSKSQTIPPPTEPPIAQTMPVTQTDASTTQLIPTTGPPEVVQTITSEGQLPVGAWNALIEQLGQTNSENKQMKQFVKKYISFNK